MRRLAVDAGVLVAPRVLAGARRRLGVVHVDAAEEARVAIDDHDLAVRAEVGEVQAGNAHPQAVEGTDLASRIGERLPETRTDVWRGPPVVEDRHLDLCP